MTRQEYMREWSKKKVAREYQREYYQKDKYKRFERERIKRYGLNNFEYARFLERQEGLCPVCNLPLKSLATESRRNRQVIVDHNHKTGVVRGLLHFKCNILLGLVKDDPTALRRAADYLEREVNDKTSNIG